jgi:hypothetical protein
MDFPTFFGYFVAFVLAMIVTDWLKKGSNKLATKLSDVLSRPLIILVHRILNKLPTKTHNDPLVRCLDGQCLKLYVNLQALESPEEPEVFDY